MSITGTVAGVPFVAAPPETERAGAPLVVGWHLQDAPCTERAFAAAVPLAGLDAWRVHLALPLSISRGVSTEELMQRGYEDAVLRAHGPVNAQGADEADAVIAELRERFGAGGPLGVFGGSAGAGIALEVTTRRRDVAALVVINPLARLRSAVDALGRLFGFEYPWTPEADAVAERMDYVARAGELGTTPVRAIVGSEDAPEFREPAGAVVERRSAAGHAADLITVEGMPHALADEPGVEPAPQNAHAAQVDAHAVAWFRQYLAR